MEFRGKECNQFIKSWSIVPPWTRKGSLLVNKLPIYHTALGDWLNTHCACSDSPILSASKICWAFVPYKYGETSGLNINSQFLAVIFLQPLDQYQFLLGNFSKTKSTGDLLLCHANVWLYQNFIRSLSSLTTPLASNWQTWHLILVVWLLHKTTSSLLCKFCSLSRLWGFRSFVLCQWLSSTAQSLTYCVYHLNGNHLIPLRWQCCIHSEQCSMNPATFHTFYSLWWQRWQTSLSLRLVIGLPSWR